jgi:hypothetical protein
LQISEVAELALDSILASLGRIIASDSGEVKIAQMKADYQVRNRLALLNVCGFIALEVLQVMSG